jgi:hypothetical protein
MIGRPKKAVLASKLSGLSQAMANLKGKCQTIWLVVKQVWYIPFLWSLAWYSYWIFRSVLILHTPPLQINAVDYLGVTISIAALLVAGYRAREPIRRSVGIAAGIGTNVKKAFSSEGHLKEGQTKSLPRKPMLNAQAEIPRQTKPEVKHQPLVQGHSSTMGITRLKKPTLQSLNTRASYSGVNRSGQVQASKDFSTECLTCAKLVNCTYRQKRANELSHNENPLPCHFAAQF